MEKIITKRYKSPFGELILGSYNERLCLCDWYFRKMREEIDRRICKELSADYVSGNSIITDEAINQLEDYFSGRRKNFDLPLLACGSDFQKEVWNELLNIPYGKTISYNDLALKLQNQLAIRAVANANGSNAISIFIPCHRVIGSKGELTGYAGGVDVKRKLLQLENREKYPDQPELF